MDSERFDRLARTLAGAASRRRTLALLLGGVATAVPAIGGRQFAAAGGKLGGEPCSSSFECREFCDRSLGVCGCDLDPESDAGCIAGYRCVDSRLSFPRCVPEARPCLNKPDHTQCGRPGTGLCFDGTCQCTSPALERCNGVCAFGAGHTCSRDIHCCEPLACCDGVCTLKDYRGNCPRPCATSGQACDQDKRCCDGLMCCDGVCRDLDRNGCPRKCGWFGDTCDQLAHCCLGYVCRNGFCVPRLESLPQGGAPAEEPQPDPAEDTPKKKQRKKRGRRRRH